MNRLLKPGAFSDAGKDQVGGKAYCLAQVRDQGFHIPETRCIPCRVYEEYLDRTGLKDRIFLEINRKPLADMRWEEIWDIALRIRNYFLTTPIPDDITADLEQSIHGFCKDTPVAVRSSAPGEDGAAASFAGLHDSFLNICGTREILKHVKLVWASLYSDAALLYRNELGLDIQTSRMAVIIQELVPSDRSGIFFGVNPSDPGESVLEAVYGLNQALVDGDIEPDRWVLNRSTGNIISHTSPVREHHAVPQAKNGILFRELTPEAAATPPLTAPQVRQIWEAGKQLETFFARPQDVEWTMADGDLTILQTRPITSAGFNDTDDKRAWYLTLHRSYENLKNLYEKIEHRLIPQMISDARKMGALGLDTLSASGLVKEIEDRQKIYDHWVKVYWADFIPFAHGIRLFGQVYNDAVAPEDPYEFMVLLENTGLKSMERNALLEGLARMIREDSALEDQLENDVLPRSDHPFSRLLGTFVDQFGNLSCTTGSGSECQNGEQGVIRLLLEFSKRSPQSATPGKKDSTTLKKAYIDSFLSHRRAFAEEVLQLGRESYRLRDDDNIHLGRIEARLFEAVREGQKRLEDTATPQQDTEILSTLPAISLKPESPKKENGALPDKAAAEKWFSSRQIVGHPAGPGIGTGRAKLIKTPQDLLSFKKGDVLVCQGVDPNMTFVVPLASAVVEERGGMLIHGAIIAREYGIPCVTGASGVMRLIQDRDRITVDGYLGIITCHTEAL
ncbi:MAG: PEP/pyruvate-binding domain-containing protein [Desulfobacter sp.]